MKKLEQDFSQDIGNKIKLARKMSEYTQAELAEKLSLSPEYISHLERGVASGSIPTLIQICKTLNISSDFLFGDFINNDTHSISNLITPKFLEVYLNLNNYNKKVIEEIANGLLKVQKDENKNNSHNKRKVK